MFLELLMDRRNEVIKNYATFSTGKFALDGKGCGFAPRAVAMGVLLLLWIMCQDFHSQTPLWLEDSVDSHTG